MEGGKYLGKGRYGCVFQGPLLCEKKQLSKTKVGKITDPEEASYELHAYKELHNIHEAKDYFIIPDSSCKPRPLESQIDQEINKCHLLREYELDKLTQIAMPYGGLALYKQTLYGPKRVNFFILFKQLLEAGSLMLLHGFVHYDIHNSNVIVDKYNIPRLIDFGQSFSVDEISLKSIGNRWKRLDPSHAVEPPEITFLTSIRNGNSFEDTVINVMPQKLILYKIEKLLGLSVKKQISSLAYFFEHSSSFKNDDKVKFWKTFYPGFDSWSIGVLLIEFYEKLLLSYEFVESSEWKLKRGIIIDILRKLLSANPKERIDCVEALNMFDPFNDIYLKYGVKWLTAKKIQRRK